jgi:hypothetical protein
MTRDAETGNVVAQLAVLLAASARFEVTRRAPTQKDAVRLSERRVQALGIVLFDGARELLRDIVEGLEGHRVAHRPGRDMRR